MSRKILFGLAMLVFTWSCAIFGESLDFSVVPTKQSYSSGQDVEVIVRMKRSKNPEAFLVFPLIFLCDGLYISFRFLGKQPIRIAPMVHHIETDLDIHRLPPRAEIMQVINLSECYQLGKGRYTLHAVYDTTQRKAVCDACDEDETVWSGILRSESITIEIIE